MLCDSLDIFLVILDLGWTKQIIIVIIVFDFFRKYNNMGKILVIVLDSFYYLSVIGTSYTRCMDAPQRETVQNKLTSFTDSAISERRITAREKLEMWKERINYEPMNRFRKAYRPDKHEFIVKLW